MGKKSRKRLLNISDDSSIPSKLAKKKRVSWAEKLERFQGEEELDETVQNGSFSMKSIIKINKVEEVISQNEPESVSDPLPSDKIEDVDVSIETEEPVKSDESITSLKPKKLKEKKPYEKFDYKTAMERTVFVGNVPYNVKASALKNLFSQYGKIEAIYKRSLLQKTEKLTKKMFGTDKQLKTTVTDAHIYVRFAREGDAKKSTELNGTFLNGRNLRVTLSSDKTNDPARSLLVGNLPYKMSEQALIEFFKNGVGDNVELLKIVHDKSTGLGKGYGFVTFKNTNSMLKALKDLQGAKFKGRGIRLTKMTKKKKRSINQIDHKQREMNGLKQKLANYIVPKKTFSKSAITSMKAIKKRKQKSLKKRSLLS